MKLTIGVMPSMMIARIVLSRVLLMRRVVMSVRMRVPVVGVFMNMILAKQVIPDMGCPVDQPYQCDPCKKGEDGE